MTIPSTQSIRLSDISVELGLARSTKMNLGHPDVRTFLGISSGKIGLGQVRGSTFGRAVVSRVINTHSQNLTINLNALPGYQAGKSDITITVDSGIYVWSDNASPALTITGGTTGDTLKLVNNGFIMGRGGNGNGYNTAGGAERPATVGNPAMNISMNITIDTLNGYIGGGGGGGGGVYGGGGGAGGGMGGQYDTYNNGGVGGAIGQPGGDGSGQYGPGGGGGRIMPGVGGAARVATSLVDLVGLGGQSGGGGGIDYLCYLYPCAGGGGWGAKGGDSPTANDASVASGFTVVSGKGGDNSQVGANGYSSGTGTVAMTGYLGAAGGKAIITNGKIVTYVGASASRVYGIVG